MSPRAAAGHACVRVGPPGSGPGTLIAGWPGLCHEGDGRCGGNAAVTGTLLAVGSRAPVPFLETADIIVADEAGGTGPDHWMRQYPGCGIAVSRTGPGTYAVASPGETLRPVTVRGPDCAGALACAVLAYGWLAAGRPLDLLRPAVLRVGPGPARKPVPGERLFFRFAYCGVSGDETPCPGPSPSMDNVVRTCSASGAPSAS